MASKFVTMMSDPHPIEFPRTLKLYCVYCERTVTYHYITTNGFTASYRHYDRNGTHIHYETKAHDG